MKKLFVLLVSKGKPVNSAIKNARKKFLKFFPEGFHDPIYYAWERGYKYEAHRLWQEQLDKKTFKKLLNEGRYKEVASRAVRIETKTNLLFSFEKMALRDAVKSDEGAELFAKGLYNYIYGTSSLQKRFEGFVKVVQQLPRIQTRVATWPIITVFGFIASPFEHMYLKPIVTKLAAQRYGFDFEYKSTPNWETYKSLLEFANTVASDNKDLNPTDYIDLQSFIWVLGSSEYD